MFFPCQSIDVGPRRPIATAMIASNNPIQVRGWRSSARKMFTHGTITVLREAIRSEEIIVETNSAKEMPTTTISQ